MQGGGPGAEQFNHWNVMSVVLPGAMLCCFSRIVGRADVLTPGTTRVPGAGLLCRAWGQALPPPLHIPQAKHQQEGRMNNGWYSTCAEEGCTLRGQDSLALHAST